MGKTTDTKTRVLQLELRDEQLLFTSTTADGIEQWRSGSIEALRNALGQGPLNGARVENAIYQVEDLIMPMLRELPECTELKVAGSDFTQLMSLFATHNHTEIRLEAVEVLFNQFVDHAGGSPIAWQHTMPVEEIALPLLVLRETLHHGGFNSVAF